VARKRTGVQVEADDPVDEEVEEPTPDEEEAPVGDDDEEAGDEETPAGEDASPTAQASEVHPELRPIEPDLADLSTDVQEGEHMAPLNAESWVVLDGDSDLVEDRYDGAIAAVIEWPTAVVQDPDTGEVTTFLPPEGTLVVKERAQGLTLSLPLDAFKEIHTSGRPDQFA
jgi:hypothetical protein